MGCMPRRVPGDRSTLRAQIVASREKATNAEPTRSEAEVRGRDLAIDFVRGLCLVSMTIGHVARTTSTGSGLDTVVHAPLLVSGAAGFIFLSGVSLALADGSRIARGVSLASRTKWMFGRAAFLYAIHLALVAMMLIVIEVRGWPEWLGPRGSSDATILELATFQRNFRFFDILPLYVAFITIAGVALRSRSNRRMVALGVTSTLVYFVSQVRPHLSSIRDINGEGVAWVAGSWQILFFGGLIAGVHWPRMRYLLKNDWHRGATAAGAAALGAIVLIRGFLFSSKISDSRALEEVRQTIELDLVGKPDLRPLRLLVIVGFGVGTYLLASRADNSLAPLFPSVRNLGSRSLLIYVASLVFTVAYAEITPSNPARLIHEVSIFLIVISLVAVSKLPKFGSGGPWSI